MNSYQEAAADYVNTTQSMTQQRIIADDYIDAMRRKALYIMWVSDYLSHRPVDEDSFNLCAKIHDMTEPLLQVIEACIKDREQKQPAERVGDASGAFGAKPHIPTYELYVLRSESDDASESDDTEHV
jgi:hypothetical protein